LSPKFGILVNSIYFYFPKTWVVTRLKHYISGDSYNEDVDVIETVSLEEFI
jgi:hypothetical protein